MFDSAEIDDVEETISDLDPHIEEFSSSVTWGMDWTAETLVSQIKKGNINLNPVFQRRDAWSDAYKSRLVESLLLGIPVPPIVLAETTEGLSRKYIVLDGKQRLLSLMRFYSTEDDEYEPLTLSHMEVLIDCNGKKYADLGTDLQSLLDNSTIRTVVIRGWTSEDFLYTVFLRLNQGSKPLTPQELRQALKPGCFTSYLDEFSGNCEGLRRVLKTTGPDKRMRDAEMALRFFGYRNRPGHYSGNLKKFLDETCEDLNSRWSNIESEICMQGEEFNLGLMQLDSLDSSIFCSRLKGREGRFNKAIFEVLAFYFSFPEVRILTANNNSAFLDRIRNLKEDISFQDATGSTTKTVKRVCLRFSLVGDLLLQLAKECGEELSLPRFDQENGHVKVVMTDA